MPLHEMLTAGLLHDTSALRTGSLLDQLTGHRTALAGRHGVAVGPLAVHPSRVAELRPLADPDGTLRVSLVADDGLLSLQEARHAIQDDTWIELDHLRIALPTGFEPAESSRALLEELAFTVPTYVEVPRTGYDTALDVLADDGAERVAYRCGVADSGGPVTGGAPTVGELAAFVHACVSRRLGFLVPSGLEQALHGPVEQSAAAAGTGTDDGAGGEVHGLLNVLAAVAATLAGAGTDDLPAVLTTTDPAALLSTIEGVPPRRLRESFRGAGTARVGATLASLDAAGAL